MLASSGLPSIIEVKCLIDARFKIRIWGLSSFFLGLEVARSSKGNLSRRKFVLDVLTDTRFLGPHPAKTPTEQNHKHDSSTGELLSDATSYVDSLAGCYI